MEPYFTNPTGEEVKLVSIDDCPYLADTWNAENAPDVANAPGLAGPVVKIGGSTKLKAALAAAPEAKASAPSTPDASGPSSSSSSSRAAKAADDELPVAGEPAESDVEDDSNVESRLAELQRQAKSLEHTFDHRLHNPFAGTVSGRRLSASPERRAAW